MYESELLSEAFFDDLTHKRRLTGLLSFMLSDEMTTGGLSSSINDKRVLATKSHAWNILQRRFKDAFPDVCYCRHILTDFIHHFSY